MGCSGDDEVDEPPRNNSAKVRGCTDVLWLCIFIVFWFLMILIAAFAIVYGNPLRLTNGYDSYGNTCGTQRNDKLGSLEFSGLDTSEKQFLLFMDLNNLRESLKICVKKCPNRNLETIKDLEAYYEETGSLLCSYNFSFAESRKRPVPKSEGEDLLTSSYGPCPRLPVYDSIPVLNRCVPKPVKALADQVISNLYAALNGWDAVEQVLGDLYASWRVILVLAFVALLLSLLMVGILHYLAPIVAWVFMICVSIAAVAGTAMLWWTFAGLKYKLDATPDMQMLSEAVRNEKAFLVYAIIATIITVILLLLVFAMRTRVSMLAQLFRESAACMADLPLLFVQPLITFLCLLAFFAFWLYVIVCLATSSYPGAKHILPFMNAAPLPSSSPSVALHNQSAPLQQQLNVSLAGVKTLTIVDYVEGNWVRYMWWVYLIGLIWTAEFILACQQMVIAGAVADWFFQRKRDGNASVRASVGKLLCYHLGSMAKGSFLITLFKLPRLILSAIYAKMKKEDEASQCARCGLKACMCCFWCLEKFIKFMNHNAYTVIAIDGSHFCSAAKTALNTIVSNALQYATLNSVGDFILFLGKCFVTAATGSAALLWLRSDEQLHFYAAPLLAVCVFSFFIAHCILSLYEMVIDTLFLCCCEDQRINGEGGHWRESFLAGDQCTASLQTATELQPMNAQPSPEKTEP